MKIIIFALIPLILSIGIIPAIPFSTAAESNRICIDKVWLENSKGKIACVTPSTAEKLVERGWGTILSDDVFEEKSDIFESGTSQKEINFQDEQNLLPLPDGGTGPLTVTPVIGELTKEYPKLYVPSEEQLSEDEMRLTFCGTGLPYATYSQASACLIVQTGDGKSYLFDVGTGSIGRINAMEIRGNDLTDVFVSHTHTDHVGDLDAFWAQAYLSGRVNPIELYGPTGANHELGTTYFVENFLKTYTWDFETRRGLLATSGQAINVHEFDYTKTQIIYDEDNFRVTAFPAIHGLDGAVSFRMDWKDLSVVFSGDTNINQYLLENSQNADVVILETFAPEEYFIQSFGWPEGMYGEVVEVHHVPAPRAALYYEIIEPRLAVSYHFQLDDVSTPLIFEDIRKHYNGNFLFAQDFTVINITPDYIVSRQADVDVNFVPGATEKMEVTDERKYFTSEWLEETVLYDDALKKILEKRNSE